MQMSFNKVVTNEYNMYRKKTLFIVSVGAITLFFCLLSYSMYSINYYSDSEVKVPLENINIIEQEIKLIATNLPVEYKQRYVKSDVFINNFLRNIRSYHVVNNTKKLWHDTDLLFKTNQMYYCNNTNIGNIINVLKSAKIVAVDTYSKGTQLKLILKLDGDHLAIFKPQWYPKEKVITGTVYAGKDRYGSEILGFYLAAILELQAAPIATERTLNLRQEVIPVATSLLNSTSYIKNNKTCIYGKCFYCKIGDPVCSDEHSRINGAIIYHFPGRMVIQRSPWQRTYKNGKKADWEINPNYCEIIKTKLPQERLLDLIEVAIFDFLIQNGDRHHYETYKNKILLIDNGKGLGNPFVHHLDILAPLYQCCMLRSSTWTRLSLLAGGYLQEILKSISDIKRVVTNAHLQAIEDRLTLVYATVDRCKMRNKLFF